MQLKESIEKTKFFIHKSIKNIKSLFSLRYEKLPKAPSCTPIFCGSGSIKKHRIDQFHSEFCNEWECNLEKVPERKRKKNNASISVTEETASVEKDEFDESFNVKHPILSPVKKKEDRLEKEKMKKSVHLSKGEQGSKMVENGGNALAKKMKELEMMDVGDVEHVLDVEEALHYYSRLKSPVYLDMVDKFFTDMYRDFSVPLPSASINSSRQRLGSIRL